MKYLFGEVTNEKMTLNAFGNVAEEELIKTKELRKNIDLDYYVIMPNHLHVIFIIESRGMARHASTERKFGKPIASSLSTLVGSYKSAVTKRINEIRKMPGQTIWQRSFYDRIIRNDKELHKIRTYISQNPLKWDIKKSLPINLEV